MHNLNLSFLLLLFCLIYASSSTDEEDLHTYIVHVTPNPHANLLNWHRSFLTDPSWLIYSYRSAVSGFAARLTVQELQYIKKHPSFLNAYRDELIPLLTTRTPEFLGLRSNSAGLWQDSAYGKGVIVGVLDTGVSPSLPSFQDNGLMPPPPTKWKGACEFGRSVCNNKLIGAKNFVRGLNAMPTDSEGHGTHIASTAAGMFVANANVDGQAKGTASGIAPYAHLAIYKVCGTDGCAMSDILGGMDAAINDGVDIMSLSLGKESAPYYNDGIAMGAFAAIQSGIFVSCAGGNSGPGQSTLSNEAPWILTIGASTLDRNIRTTVTLGNGQSYDGESLYQPSNTPPTTVPLVYPGGAAAYCKTGTLKGIKVAGKIVVCDDGNIGRDEKSTTVKNAGGLGVIIAGLKVQGYITSPDAHLIPASDVSYADGLKIKAYIASTTAPKASITYKGTILGSPVSPVVAYFSSRGPNKADKYVLKPDILGPGVNILAAWPFNVGTPPTKFNIISGTSMAAPHLTGVAALLKSAHPDWSPAAIKSAMMTTAGQITNNGSMILDQNMVQANFFAVGAGHVNPVAATNPGLIYDMSPDDYIPYLCGLRLRGYSDRRVTAIVHKTVKCADYKSITGTELNYPSFAVFLTAKASVVRVTRTVTNVGPSGSSYKVQIVQPVGATVTVSPDTLTFSSANEKKQFTVTFVSNRGSRYSEGYLTWVPVSGGSPVNSPIIVSDSSGGSVQFM